MSDVRSGTAGENALRVQQIFRYLAEAGESRVKPVRTLDQVRHLEWLGELPQGRPEVRSFLDAPLDGDEPRWLTVARPEHHGRPAPGALLRPWLAEDEPADRPPAAPPALRDSAEAEDRTPAPDGAARTERRIVRRQDSPDCDRIEEEYRTWSTAWQEWARRREESAPQRRLYGSLFRIHEDATALGESFELVLGFGLLTWTAAGEPIRRHLLTTRAVLELDQQTGTLTLAPAADSAGLVLEEGMLDAGQKIRSEHREVIRGLLDEAGGVTGPDGVEYVHQALGAWVNAAHESGSYLRGAAPQRAAGTASPTVAFAPALLLRERSRRTGIESLHGIARALEQGTEPTELLRFIAGDERTAPAAADTPADGSAVPAPPAETYFSLPSNEEQRTIAERLRDSRLVVVQGPPGTGKTHTIANLVTDLLAHGQRVLITSHTARALKVLKDKLPRSIRELCVSRTDEGLAAQQELRGSVSAILERQGGYDRRDYERRIAATERRLHAAREARARALAELRALREQETYRHPAGVGDYCGTLQEIARRLAEDRAALGWLGAVPTEQPQLDKAAAFALLTASRAYRGADRAAVAAVEALPGESELPAPAAFARAVAAVEAAEDGLARQRDDEQAQRLDALVAQLDGPAQEAVAGALAAYRAAVTGAGARLPDWAAALYAEALTGEQWQLRARHEQTGRALAAARAAADALGDTLVTGLDGHDLQTALGLAGTLADGLGRGERLRGPLGTRSRLRKAVGGFPETVRVNGAPADRAPAAELVRQRIELERHLQQVELDWNGVAEAWQSAPRRLAALEADGAVLQRLVELCDRRGDLLAALAAVPGLVVEAWHRPETCATVGDLLAARAALRAAEQPRALLADAERTLLAWADRPDGAPALLGPMLAAVTARDVAGYERLGRELAVLRGCLERKTAYRQARGPVAAVLPKLAQRLADTPDLAEWDVRLAEFEQAWAWSAWSARMRELTDPAAEEKQRALLAEADATIRIALEKLAADRSWHGCLERLTDTEAVALASYQQSVGRLGKGTGRYAHRYRAQAAESLRECQGAVPAWIMPFYQVTATVPMDVPGRFDVVIIDEASQSGPEAMLLAWLGRKIVVVGDDKQVSPANVGIDHEQLFQLQNRMLDALPAVRRNLFGPTASFFDIASVLAGGRGRLMLQEHFRCMPEIIGFSNELAYHGRLQPLRQYGADRLPPIRTVYVPEGFVEGSGQRQVNVPEAERLVEQLAACCADPAYQDRSMGVITMLGAAQRRLIEDLLAERLPMDEWQRRRIRVGDAEDFQGDERDVVFIAMVVSPTGPDGPRRIGAFSGESYQQRINVAASRARDQVWLFHSFAPTELGPTDLRRRYLDHCTRPAEEQDGLGLDGVQPDVPHEAFDSLFEQRVFLALRDRGFRVRPQYPAGRYRIDLVVEGGTRRLAVECDGDAFHNEENADADAARQRELERVGWTFVRIRGSRFFLDPDRALRPLWKELDALGITPVRPAAGPAVRPAPTAVRAVPSPAPGAAGVDGAEGGQPGAGPGAFPVSAVSEASHRRARQELDALAEGPPDGTESEPDRQRREGRRDFLRAYLAHVVPEPRPGGPGVVVPGSVVGLEYEGGDGVVRCAVAALPVEGAERISPDTPLGRALLWAEVGEHVSYTTGTGAAAQAVVRFVED
ncbi:AAA domain-containing protein [Kitasatospora sp. NPDC059571]|uniref:AAA domain-containing protein n=1 Tax=Kitasatospora sp. NPDC059571 TaxID=3346871 RepID=UPI003689BE0A